LFLNQFGQHEALVVRQRPTNSLQDMEFDSFDIDVKQPSPAGQFGPGAG